MTFWEMFWMYWGLAFVIMLISSVPPSKSAREVIIEDHPDLKYEPIFF